VIEPAPFGWWNRPHEVARVLATLPEPFFADAAAHLAGAGASKTVLLSDAARRVTGAHLPAQKQLRGTCVSRGFARAVDYLQCVQIALGHRPEQYASISHAAVYGMAREIGHDLSTEDGAVGAWAAQAVSEWGVVTNADAHDRDQDDDALAVDWGAHGCPSAIKELARHHLVATASLVKTPDEARDALVNGYPLAVCSDQGFTMTRDASGLCRPRGSWNHCMMWSGYRDDRRQFLVEQSWGPNCPDGPTGDLDIPDNAFWIDWDTAARMLAQGDSFALSHFQGFPAQTLDWLI
jgi:hypothetical protein